MADMLPVVADTHFDRLCAVDDYTSFIWATRYYEPGDFELTVPMSSHNLQFLQVNNYVMRGDNDSEMGIIERREVTQDLNGQETMTVSGRFLSSILARRIIAQQTQVSGTIANCVTQLINVSAINPTDTARKLPITIGTLDIPATQMQQQFTGTNLLEAIVNICKTYFVGFALHYDADSDGMVFDMFTGVDRSYGQSENTYAVFSSEYGNLQSSDYVEDASAVVTNVLVAGEGEGLERKTIWASKGNPTGLSRYELYQDARNASTNNGAISDSVYYQQLQDEGAESLADMAQMFAGQVTFDNIEFGTDLNIGDICTIESVSWGMYMDARLVEVIESVGETGAYTITPSFEAVSTQDVLQDAALLTERGNIRITSESGARLLAQTRALSATGGEVKISELEEATTLNDDDAFPMATSGATLKVTWATILGAIRSLVSGMISTALGNYQQKPVVLFTGVYSDTYNKAITLSENAENFTRLLIEWRTSDGAHGSTWLDTSSQKVTDTNYGSAWVVAAVAVNVATGTAPITYIKHKDFAVSGNKIGDWARAISSINTCQRGEITLRNNGAVTTTNNELIGITKVIGWR